MIRRFALLTVLVLGCGGGAWAAPLTVVAFNVESDGSSDLVIGHQLERSSDVDLWGLTEIYRKGGWVEKMRSAAGVGEGAEFGAVVGRTGRDNESLVLYRSDRLRLLGSEELAAAAGGRNDPAPLVARFQLDGSEIFLFVLVRLSDRESTRRQQAEALADWAAQQTLPVIAAGTFGFGVPEGGTAGDAAMSLLTARADWEWVRPPDAYATACGQPRLVQDFVFAGGAAKDWAGQAEVMFRQSNYCADGESGRSSDFRPVLAGFHTDGTPGGIVGAMPEREVGPLLPADVARGEVREVRDEGRGPQGADPRLPPLVTEAGSSPSPNPPVTPSDEPRPAPPQGSAAPAAGGPAADPEREALLRRLEALEREAQAIRRELEEGADAGR